MKDLNGFQHFLHFQKTPKSVIKRHNKETLHQGITKKNPTVQKSSPWRPHGPTKGSKGSQKAPKWRHMGPQMGAKMGHGRMICLIRALGPISVRFRRQLEAFLEECCLALATCFFVFRTLGLGQGPATLPDPGQILTAFARPCQATMTRLNGQSAGSFLGPLLWGCRPQNARKTF